MEELNKTQIIYLTLLVSFVTSIATGIVTVTLMDQAPPAITQTINHVVEKTIETVIPGEIQKTTVVTKEVIVREEDKIVTAVDKNRRSIVTISGVNESGKLDLLGIGAVVSADGLILVDKDRMLGNRNNLVVSVRGVSVKANIMDESQDEYYILQADTSAPGIDSDASGSESASSTPEVVEIAFSPVVFADSDQAKLGQTIISVNAGTVATGIISAIDRISGQDDTTESTRTIAQIKTSILGNATDAGGLIINLDGFVVGVSVLDASGAIITLPSNDIKKAVLNISAVKEAAPEGE